MAAIIRMMSVIVGSLIVIILVPAVRSEETGYYRRTHYGDYTEPKALLINRDRAKELIEDSGFSLIKQE